MEQGLNSHGELDPLDSATIAGFGSTLYTAREYDSAIHEFQKALELDPDYVDTLSSHLGLEWAYQQKKICMSIHLPPVWAEYGRPWKNIGASVKGKKKPPTGARGVCPKVWGISRELLLRFVPDRDRLRRRGCS